LETFPQSTPQPLDLSSEQVEEGRQKSRGKKPYHAQIQDVTSLSDSTCFLVLTLTDSILTGIRPEKDCLIPQIRTLKIRKVK
jgi:hypothetical protein